MLVAHPHGVCLTLNRNARWVSQASAYECMHGVPRQQHAIMLLIQRQLHSFTHDLLQAEEAERRTLIANRDVNDASQDLTKLRRTSLSVQSAPRSLDLHAVVGAAAQKAVSVVGQEALVEVGSFHCYAQTSCSCSGCSVCLNNATLSRLHYFGQAWDVC